jgi:phospholipid/cholesterol/gamma-HCH transport system substrate-binding protein
VHFPDTGGVGTGSDVSMAGKRIGRVSDVAFANPNNLTKGIVFALSIDRNVNLPGDVNFYAQTRGLIGSSSIEVRQDRRPPGSQRKTTATDQPLAMIPRDDSTVLEGGQPEPGAGGILPPDMLADAKELVKNVNSLAKSLDTFFTPPTTSSSAPTSQPATPNIYVTLEKFDRVMDNANVILGDKANQENLKATLDELHQLSSTLVADAGQLGKLLSTINSAFVKIDKGEGTLGKLLNDPALYNTMVDASTALKGVLSQLTQLTEQWKREGLGVHLK